MNPQLTQDIIFQIQKELLRYIDIKKSIKKRLNNILISDHRKKQLFNTLGLVNTQIQRRMIKIETPKESDLQLQIVEAKLKLQRDHNTMTANQVVHQKNWISILENKAS